MIRDLVEKSRSFRGYDESRRVTREELLELQHHATMSIVYKVENTQTKYCFATKIGEILMAGIPLITTDYGEQNYYLKDKENAYIVEAGKEDSLSETIKYVLSHQLESKRVGEQGKAVAQNDFNPLQQGEKLYKFFVSL